jgi:hypothetical protein
MRSSAASTTETRCELVQQLSTATRPVSSRHELPPAAVLGWGSRRTPSGASSSGRRGRRFKSGHPDGKTVGHRPPATCGLLIFAPGVRFWEPGGSRSCFQPLARAARTTSWKPSRNEEPSAAIQYFDASSVCRAHWPYGNPHLIDPRKRVRVVDIAQVKAGWLARGEIRQASCSFCYTTYRELAHYIPIECATFPCPSCGPGSELTTEILSITETEAGYSFVAMLKCDACSKQRRLSKILGGLSKITKLKVGPTGVEVEVKP